MCDTGYYGYENVNIMVHALVGYVSGELAGSKSSFSNALAAGVNKFVTEEILKDEKTRLHYKEHPEELQWISAALGAAIGQMAGGDATSGASIAASGTKNNWLYRDEQEELAKNIRKITNKQFLDEQDIQQLTVLMQEAGLISKENIAMDPIHSENIIPELRSALNSIKTTDFVGVKFRTDDSIGLDKNIENFNNDFAKIYYEYKPINDTVSGITKSMVMTGIGTFGEIPAGVITLYSALNVGYDVMKYLLQDNVNAGEHAIVNAGGLLANEKVSSLKKKVFVTLFQSLVNKAIDRQDDKKSDKKIENGSDKK